jgi:hypothetical protein
MRYLEQALEYFGTNRQNKLNIYKRVQHTKGCLEDLRNELSNYNNVIAGEGNYANGNKNVVVGTYNTVNGSNNWIFVSKFTGKINGDLLFKKWRI